MTFFFVCVRAKPLMGTEFCVGGGGCLLELKLGVCVGGSSCASNLVCVCGGHFLPLKLGVCLCGHFLFLKQGVCGGGASCD